MAFSKLSKNGFSITIEKIWVNEEHDVMITYVEGMLTGPQIEEKLAEFLNNIEADLGTPRKF